MELTEQEKRFLEGEAGEAVRLAMAILVELGDAIGAPEMVEIEHVHTDSGFYLGDAGLEFVKHLAAYGSIRECVGSAVAGKIMRERPAWLSS